MSRTALTAIATLIAVVGWFVLKDPVYRHLTKTDDLAVEALDYSDPASWLSRPDTAPPGGWETPWGVDLFVVAPRPTQVTGVSVAVVAPLSSEGSFVSEIAKSYSDSEVYAPQLRYPSARIGKRIPDEAIARLSDDVMASLTEYLSEDNRMRGFVLLVPSNLMSATQPALELIENDPSLLERFGGVIVLGKPLDLEIDLACSEAFSGDCAALAGLQMKRGALSFLFPSLPTQTARYELRDEETFADLLKGRMSQLSIWLDEALPKPAEPLGGLETMESIEIAPVRRPGDTED